MTGVIVTFGPDSETYGALIGIDLATGIENARQILSVPSDVSARLNGNTVSDTSIILKDGDEISFYKASGTKGNF